MIAFQELHSDIFCAKGLGVVRREYHHVQFQEQARKEAAREQRHAKNQNGIKRGEKKQIPQQINKSMHF
jgi:hypothetical protein